VWSLLLSAPRAVVELQRQRRRLRRRGVGRTAPGRSGLDSDADQLARLTGVPAGLWSGLFWLVCLGCLVVGGWLLWPFPSSPSLL
jgi:hypothetical protein